jgi:hypothetical protein
MSVIPQTPQSFAPLVPYQDSALDPMGTLSGPQTPCLLTPPPIPQILDPLLVNIVNDAACSCGAPREDAFHYFFTCPNYTEIRRIMMNNLNWVQTSDLNLNLLTCGSDDLTYEENINIIKHVFNFIKSSKRFLVV